MFSFYPVIKETRLVTLSEKQFYGNLEKFIKPVEPGEASENGGDFLFNGVWDRQHFIISLILKISNNFVPLVRGEMVSSQEGILVQIYYCFFPATKKLLLFWTLLTFILTFFFIGVYQAWLYGAISFGFCIVNYILALENFKIQVRKSQRMIEKLFSYTEE
jgi:hypothetical protein